MHEFGKAKNICTGKKEKVFQVDMMERIRIWLFPLELIWWQEVLSLTSNLLSFSGRILQAKKIQQGG